MEGLEVPPPPPPTGGARQRRGGYYVYVPGSDEQPPPGIVFRARDNGKDHDDNGNDWSCAIWVIVGLVAIVFIGWLVASFWWYPNYYGGPWPPPPHKGGAPFETNDTHGAYVFRNARGRQPPRRGSPQRNLCQAVVGEVWDEALQMCTPRPAGMGVDASLLNATAPPCGSFHNSMCGAWNDAHAGQGDRLFTFAAHRNRVIVERVVQSADDRTTALGRFYRSCINDAYYRKEVQYEYQHVRNLVLGKRSYFPFARALTRAKGNVRMHSDLPMAFGRLARYGYAAPIVLGIEKHPYEPRMLPMLSWDGVPNATQAHVTHTFDRTRDLTQYATLVLVDRVRRASKVVDAMRAHGAQPAWTESSMPYDRYLREHFRGHVVKWGDLPVWRTPHRDAGAWQTYLQALGASNAPLRVC